MNELNTFWYQAEKKINRGQTLVEYLLIILVICVISIGINKLFANALKNYFNKIVDLRSGIKGMLP